MKTLVFFGDSITEFGVRHDGYIGIIHSFLKKDSLDKNYQILGAGWRGDKVSDLLQRHREDVISRNPDIIVIYIGINDVWHFPPVKSKKREDAFKHNYQSLLSSIKNNTRAQVIMCTLSVIGERRNSNPYDSIIETYSSIIKSLALENKHKICDLRQRFLDYIRKENTNDSESGILTMDGVHLNSYGNRLVAEALYPLLLS